VPRSQLSRDRIGELLPVPVTDPAFDDLLFASKAEVEGREGDQLTVAVTPDRLDLLSEGGLALYLAGALEVEHGIPRAKDAHPTAPAASFQVDPSVDPIRPWIAGALVRSPDDRGIDVGTLAEAIRFQELLHATVGRDRRAASLGIYPWERLASPVRYSLEPLSDVRFVPLDGPEEVAATRFFAEHPLAARYGALGRLGDRCLVLRDRQGTVLSLPPILNGRAGGEARVGDRELLIEATGTRERSVREAVGLLLVVFAARHWSVHPVAVEGAGRATDDGRSLIAPRSVDLPSSVVRDIAGEVLSSAEVERRLSRSRLSPRPMDGGWRVDVPPWRPDVLTAVDLAEDVVLAAAIVPERGIVPPSPVRGRRLDEIRFRRRVASDLLGLGFAAPHTPLLVSLSSAGRAGGPEPIRMRNPVSNEFAFVRDRLLLSHLDVLAHNTRHAYPQRFAEVGPVVVREPAAEAGAVTRYHAGLVVADESAGFAEAAALVDYLLRRLDVGAIREPIELSATIPGRAARARLAGEAVAEMGELHPKILADLGVPVPVAWAELDLSALWPLVARHDTD
jgi:phenylalanyl-tRNA synthetase beta chain